MYLFHRYLHHSLVIDKGNTTDKLLMNNVNTLRQSLYYIRVISTKVEKCNITNTWHIMCSIFILLLSFFLIINIFNCFGEMFPLSKAYEKKIRNKFEYYWGYVRNDERRQGNLIYLIQF